MVRPRTIPVTLSMLQFIRSKAGSFFFKILFVILIASFGIWGIGDFLRQRSSQESTVIAVGDRKITGEELRSEVQRELDRYQGQITMEQAKALGMVQQVVERDVNQALLDQEVTRQHILVSDDQLRDVVQHEPAFRGEDGKFDREKFLTTLMQSGMGQAQYEAMIRGALPRNVVAGPAIEGVSTPSVLADLLYRSRNEHRIADWLYLPNGSVKNIPAPDDKALHEFYDKHHETYTAPEFRGFTLLPLQTSDVASSVTITDDQLKDTYQQRIDSFTTPEKRHVLQMLLHDEKSAADAEQALSSGKDFFAVAKDVAKQEKADVDLGTVEKKELPPQIAERAFSAKVGEATQPEKDAFGWSIIKVDGVEPGGVKSFEDAKAEIEADLRKTAEGDALYELQNKVQDALSAGSDPAQIAEQFKLRTVTFAAADHTGHGPDGKLVAGIVFPVEQVMKTVFDTQKDQVSPLQDVGQGGGYFVVKVTSITPSALKPYDEVVGTVTSDWIADQRATRNADHAKALVEAIKPDNPLSKLAAAQKLQAATTPPFTRSNQNHEAPLPEGLVSKLFGLEAGQAASEAGPEGQFVAQLKEIKPADPAADKSGLEQVSSQLDQGMGGDLMQQFEGALRQRYKVEIRQATIDQLFSSTPE